MGKRELLLIAVFVVVGAVVYRVTAPTDASGRGFSISKLIESIRSEMRGQNVELVTTRTGQADAAEVTTLRIGEVRGIVRITGEEREDVAVELRATVFGVDEAQTRQFEKEISLSVEAEGEAIDVRLDVRAEQMRRRAGVQLTVRVPSRLAVHINFAGGELEAARVAGVTFERGTGKAVLSAMSGPVSGEFESGTIEIDQAQAIELDTRRAEIRLTNIAGDVKLEAEGGDVRLRNVKGASELSIRRVDAEIEDIKGPIKLDGEGGQLRLRHPNGPVIIDSERMEIALTLSTAVPVEVTTSGETIEVMLPPHGLQLQAVANHGQIRVSDPGITVTDEEETHRASGTLRGGGPLIKLETTRGDIIIR